MSCLRKERSRLSSTETFLSRPSFNWRHIEVVSCTVDLSVRHRSLEHSCGLGEELWCEIERVFMLTKYDQLLG